LSKTIILIEILSALIAIIDHPAKYCNSGESA